MRSVLLLYNPQAARARAGRVQAVERVLRSAGCRLDVVAPDSPDGVVEAARQGAEAGVDVVAVYGGDGTVMLGVQGMIGHEVLLGVIPGGTGNLLAGNLGIPRVPERAAAVVVGGVERRIDLGRIETVEDVRYFAVAAGAGYDAELMGGTRPEAKRRWGMGAYVAECVRTLRDLRSHPFRLVIDDRSIEVDAASVLIANCGKIMPPLIDLGDDVTLDDGLLDVVTLKADGIREACRVVWDLYRGRTASPRLQRFRGRTVRVEVPGRVPVQRDGDADGCTPFTASVVPDALGVIVPAG